MKVNMIMTLAIAKIYGFWPPPRFNARTAGGQWPGHGFIPVGDWDSVIRPRIARI
jgi:hypothetical protein